VTLSGSAQLPLSYVENCADVAVLSCVGDAGGETINVVDDELPTRREYVRELAARRTPRPAVFDVPWALLELGANSAGLANRLAGGRLPLPGLVNTPHLHARCKPLRYDNARAHEVLGWRPRCGFREALARALG
jgi:nucleoside-diphosphate-sugar epimerase